MNLHHLVEESYQTFLEQSQRARIVLLHPESRYRSLLIAKLVNEPSTKVLYYSLGPDDIDLPAFLVSITHDLADQYPTFGRHINMLPQEMLSNPLNFLDTILDRFIKDLNELEDNEFLLILDEYDRSDTADDVQRFTERLSTRLPDRCRMVINSRTLPRLPWIAMIAEGRAILLKDEMVISKDFYGTHVPSGSTMMEVFALGPGHVLKDGFQVDSWEGHLPRLLFFFALDRPVVTRSEICQAFWPELDADQAVNVFHVTKRRLHKALDADVLIHEDTYYRVNPDIIVYYDVIEFTQALMRARYEDDPDKKMAAWQRTVDLYDGPFLHGHDEEWIVERREEYSAAYLEALVNIAHVQAERGLDEKALSLLHKAIEENYLREDIHRDIMILFTDIGRRSEAAAHYQKLQEEMDRRGYKISDETKALYQELKSR